MASEGLRLINIGVTIVRDFPVDTISLDVSLGGTRDTRDECTEEYNRLLGEVVGALTGIGIPKEEIKNSDYRVSAHTERLYRKDEDGDYYHAADEVNGYDYSAHMRIRVPFTEDDAKAIWIALSGCDEAVRYEINFGLDDEDSAKSSLLVQAVEEGHRRAELLAGAAGAKVVGIHAIDYNFHDSNYWRYALACPSGSDSFEPLSSAPSFNPEDETINCSVKMQWRMEPV